MKVGDKLTCKKSRLYNDMNIKFIEGRIYEIIYINDGETFINISEKGTDDYYQSFEFNELENNYIWKYFYKPVELRKNKLKTIL